MKKALGIDFGTSNSYFSEISGDLEPNYEDLKFHDGNSSVPTCVIYKWNGKEMEPLTFGQAAIDLWTDLTEDEREMYQFHSGFKPDISYDSSAYKHAVAFFQCIKRYFSKEGLDYLDSVDYREIVVGIPAKNIEGQENQTREALREAGLPRSTLVPEPQGALYYHLCFDRQKITVEKAHQGVIVIDFGGGTLDIAYLLNGKVKNVWGNPLIGGRLFDDLFFQWFLDTQQDPYLLKTIEADGNLHTLMNFSCRRLKERFSNAWENGRIERFRDRVSVGIDYDYGVFRGVSLEEFYERARNYRISKSLLGTLQVLQDPLIADAVRGESMDLIATIKQAIVAQDVDTDIPIVVLTGGSCRWPFMKEIVGELFPQAELFRSNNPEATISRGLGIRVFMDQRAQRIGEALQQNKDKLQSELMKVLMTAYENIFHYIANKFVNDFFVSQIRPQFFSWRENGGSVRDLEKESEQLANSYFNSEAQQVIHDSRDMLKTETQEAANRCIEIWLREHAIERVEYLDIPVNFDGTVDSSSGVDDILEGFFGFIEICIVGLFGAIAGSILGGAGTALLISGPLGWMIGFILGAVGAVMAISNIDAKDIHIPAMVLQMIASDAKIDEAQEKFRQTIYDKMQEAFAKTIPELEKNSKIEIDILVREIIKRLSVTAIIKD